MNLLEKFLNTDLTISNNELIDLFNQVVEEKLIELSGFLNQNMKQQLVMHVSSIKNLKG